MAESVMSKFTEPGRQSRISERESKISKSHSIITMKGEKVETDDADFSYREVSAISEATDDVYSESPQKDVQDADLNDYNHLIQTTQRRLKVLSKSKLFIIYR